VATIHGLEIAGAVHALVMELIDGPTLAERLRSGPLRLKQALDIGRQIAEALEAAHEKGIIHRDLKPANVKLTATSHVKVLDFGLAKAIAPEASELSRVPTIADAATRENVIAGTPAYMSPEQARGQGVDKRSDVWAFGCVLYELLSGKPVFSGITANDTLAAVLEREPEWTALPHTVPGSIRRLLQRCLDKDPRRRFHDIADVRIEIEDALREPVTAEPSAALDTSPRRTRVIVTAALLLLVSLVAVIAMLNSRAPASAPELRVDISTPPAPDSSGFAISPDGRQIAFVAEFKGQPTLWVRSLDAAVAQPLPNTEGARHPFWSPDSRAIGFFAENGGLKRIDARGGSSRVVTSDTTGGMGGAWGPDGTILFSDAAGPSLRRVNASGGSVSAVASSPAGSFGQRHAQFLPGGREFLFFAVGSAETRGVYVGSLDSSDVTRIVASDSKGVYVAPGWLAFVRQGTLLAQRFDLARRSVNGEPISVADSVAFDPVTGTAALSAANGVIAYRANRSSLPHLSWFDRSGKVLGTFGPGDQVGLSNVMLSPDGRRVAVERTVANETDLSVLDSVRQIRLPRGSSDTLVRFPVWSRDGNRIAFEAFGSGTIRLGARPSSGGGSEEVLFESPQAKIPTDWSPDGQFLLYFVPDPKTGTDLWVLPINGARIPVVFLKGESNEVWGQFSPDGHWVAYQSNETRRFEIYVRPFPGPGELVPISTEGGVYPRWSRDGKELYYIAPDSKLMAVSVSIKNGRFEAGTPTALFMTSRVGGGANVVGRSQQYDVAGDGRFLINVEADSSPTPITLLVNWKP
jgi:serine/threonine protein kinase